MSGRVDLNHLANSPKILRIFGDPSPFNGEWGKHLPPYPHRRWLFNLQKILRFFGDHILSGRVDLNHRPSGPEPDALNQLRYAPLFQPSFPSSGTKEQPSHSFITIFPLIFVTLTSVWKNLSPTGITIIPPSFN